MKSVFLIIFFLLPVGLIVFIKYMGGKMHHKKLKWIFGSYIAILLISLVGIHMIPNGNFLKERATEQNGEWMIDREYQDFYSAAKEGRLDQIESAYKNKEWSFEYTEEWLKIETVDRENFDVQIVVKNKDIDDNIIEATSYIGRSIVNGIEYTDKVKPPEVILEGNQLKIIKPGRLEIKLAEFDRDLTIRQFFSGSRSNNSHRGLVNISHTLPVLYIQVPKNVQVEGYH